MSSFNAGKIEANLTLGRSQWVKDLRTVKKEIADLERRGITIEIDADSTNAQIVMDNIEMLANDLDNSSYAFDIDANATEANAKLEALEEKADRLDSKIIGIEADADITNAMIQLDILENQMDVLENDGVDIQVDVDSLAAEGQLIALAQFVNNLDGQEIDLQVDVDGYATAIAQMLTLEGQIAVLNEQNIDIDVDVDRAALESLVGAGAGAAGGGGGGSLGLLRILIYAIILLSPILAVAMGAATAAIIAFAAAVAAAGAAALVLGGGLIGLVQRFKDTDPSDYTPAMQAFADAIDEVKEAYDAFLDSIAVAGYGVMTDALGLAAQILPTLTPLFNATADAIGGVMDSMSKWIDSPQYAEMIAFFSDFGVDMLVQFLEIGGNLLVFFGELFAAIEPFARVMMQGLEDLTQGWADWAEELENNQAFQEFMDNALIYGPMVLNMLGSLVDAFMNVGDALRPFAGPMLEGLTAFFDMIANVDPEVLTGLIGGFAGLWAGAHIVLPLLQGIGGAVTGIAAAAGVGVLPILLVAGAIAAIVAAVIQLWDESETFRSAVIGTWEAIRDTVNPIVEDITAAIEENWGPMVEWATEIWNSFKTIVTDAMIIIQVIVTEVLAEIQMGWQLFGDDIIAVVTWAFEIIGQIITGAFDVIGGIFATISGILTGDWDKAWEGIKQTVSGALTILGALLSAFIDPVTKKWELIGGAAKKAWDASMQYLREKWNSFREWLGGKWESFKEWIGGWAVKPLSLFTDIQTRWNNVKAWVEGKWENFKGWVSGWAPNLPSIWDDITAKWTAMKTAIENKWTNFKAMVSGWTVSAGGVFDGLKAGFVAALNAIIGAWNNFSLTVDIPDKIPGLPDSYTVSTPNVSPIALAEGAYLTHATLAVVGEAGPEIVAPEPVLRQIVQEHSGAGFDAGAVAAAIAAVLAPLMRELGLNIEELTRIIAEAGVGMTITARADGNGDDAAQNLATEIAYQMRLAGFGGSVAA